MTLLLPWNKVSFRSRALLPGHIWAAKNPFKKPSTLRPEGTVVTVYVGPSPQSPPASLALPGVPLLCVFLTPPHSLSPFLLLVKALPESLCPCSQSSLPFNKLQLSQMSDRQIASALNPAKARASQAPG